MRSTEYETGTRLMLDNVLRVIFVISISNAIMTGWRVFGRRVHLNEAVVPSAASAEEPLDSVLSVEVARVSAKSPPTRAHRLTVFLDPASPRMASVAHDIGGLFVEPTDAVAVTLLFAPEGNATVQSPIGEAIALECSRRLGHLSHVVDAIGSPSHSANTSWSSVGMAAGMKDVAPFVDCIRRRDTAAEVMRSLVLARRLRLEVRPGFVLDDTVIRGRITVDSIRSRLRMKVR